MQILLEKEFQLIGKNVFDVWNVYLYVVENINLEYIFTKLQELGCKSECIKEAVSTLYSQNVGFTYSNLQSKNSIIIIGRQDNIFQLINTIAHESRHLQQHIANYYNLNQDGELVCYLLGHIVQKIYTILYNNQLL